MAVVTITNQKGGVGKTVTATNLAVGLARKGKTVLALDLDPQAPLATAFGACVSDDLMPIADAMKQRKLQGIACPTRTASLWLIPGDLSLDPQALANEMLRDTVLDRSLKGLRERYDYILLDTPPNLDLVTLNAIMASDWLILPCDADRETLESLKRTLEVTYRCLQFRPDMAPEWFAKVLMTIQDDRDRTVNAWLREQLRGLGNPPFQTIIHRATAYKKARAHGLSIFEYDEQHPNSGGRKGVEDFQQLTEEVIAYETKRRNRHKHRTPVLAG
jgi:chromosome partitioning protein